MGTYLIVKWMHVVSSTILFGTGLGAAFCMLMASRGGEPKIAYVVARHVVLGDWVVMTAAVIVQPLTGIYLVHVAGYTWTSTWVSWSIVLYFLAGACWLPSVWMRVGMREIARAAAASGEPLPARYFRLHRIGIALGIPAFAALLIVFCLMVAKPV